MSTAEVKETTARPSSGAATHGRSTADALTEAEQALWRDPEALARIEAVLDDPSRAVPLDELD